MAQLAIAEEKAKNNKNSKFIDTAGLKAAKEASVIGDGQENQSPEKRETESEKKQRERFERLQN